MTIKRTPGATCFAADHLRGRSQILQPPVGARAEERLLDLRPRHLRQRRHIVHTVRDRRRTAPDRSAW